MRLKEYASYIFSSISFSTLGTDNTITCPAGGLGQKVEDLNIAGGTYIISWTGTAACTVDGDAKTNGASVTLTANTQADVIFSSGTLKNPQLEEGAKVTNFEYRNIGSELTMCQRYYEIIGLPSTDNNFILCVAQAQSSDSCYGSIGYVAKRTIPSITLPDTGFTISNSTGVRVFTTDTNTSGLRGITIAGLEFTRNGTFSAGDAVQVDLRNGQISIDAEL